MPVVFCSKPRLLSTFSCKKTIHNLKIIPVEAYSYDRDHISSYHEHYFFFITFCKNQREVSKITYIFLSPELKSLAENHNTHSSQTVSPSLKSVHISRKHAEMKPCNKRLFTIYSTFAFFASRF